MSNKSLSYYIEVYAQGKATPDEKKILLQYINDPSYEEELNEVMQQHWDFWERAAIDFPETFDRVVQAITTKIIPEQTAQIPSTHRVHFMRKWGWAAAAIIVLLGTGTYFFFNNKEQNENTVATIDTNKIPPGKDGAILTLADGQQVQLDSLGNGLIASQNGSQAVIKDGSLVYNPTGEKSGDIVYNTMLTPKGRQFSLLLPDGTKVWLNAASSIRYPTVFAGKERQVQLTGEAYFEVTENSKMPFRVSVNNKVTVDVLGTHFNVNGYANETSINTTLLEGAVKVNGTIIKPGQQAQFLQHTLSAVQIVNDIDADKIMAWKNGLINFDGVAFEEIMRQLERWYDIEVVYENNKVPNKRLAGEMTRDVPLDGLLKNLEKMGLHYKIDGRKLIVLP